MIGMAKILEWGFFQSKKKQLKFAKARTHAHASCDCDV